MIGSLIINENTIVDRMIEKKVPEKIAQDIVKNFLEYRVIGIPMKYLIFTSISVLIFYRLRKI